MGWNLCCSAVAQALSWLISSAHLWDLQHVVQLLQDCPCVRPAPLPPPGSLMPMEPAGRSPRAEQVMRSAVWDFRSDIHRRVRFPPAWAHQSSSFVPPPCSLLKLPVFNPAVYSRRCQDVSLWWFMASNVLPFTAYFRCNKGEMKGPLKENALSWHYLLCGMFPELLLNECCLYPCTIHPVPHRMLSLLAGAPFLAGFLPLQPTVHRGPAHSLQKEEMLEPVAGAAAARVQLLLWVLVHPF